MFVHERRRAVRINDEVLIAYAQLNEAELKALSVAIDEGTGSENFSFYSTQQERKMINLSVSGLAFPIHERVDEGHQLAVGFSVDSSEKMIVAIVRVVACDVEEDGYVLRGEFKKISSADTARLSEFINMKISEMVQSAGQRSSKE